MKKEELKLLREEGEGQLVEFKEKTANIDKEMVAFANGSGGKIWTWAVVRLYAGRFVISARFIAK